MNIQDITEADLAALQSIRDRFPTLTAEQVQIVYQAGRMFVESWCWRDGSQLEDMIDALTWELREWQDCAETKDA